MPDTTPAASTPDAVEYDAFLRELTNHELANTVRDLRSFDPMNRLHAVCREIARRGY